MAPQVTTPQRIDLHANAPGAWDAMVALETAIGLEPELGVLVKLRASLLNGCVYCIDLHSTEGLEAGQSHVRLFGLAAWRESPYFSERERAALALTDSITLVTEGNVPDGVWEEASRHFDRMELARLIWTVVAINSWNRLAITARVPPARPKDA